MPVAAHSEADSETESEAESETERARVREITCAQVDEAGEDLWRELKAVSLVIPAPHSETVRQ